MLNFSKKNIKKNTLVDVLDNEGKTLLQMPITVCLKQKLRRKIALVTAKNINDKFILRRHSIKAKHNSGLWDISAYANVYVGESCEEAAMRELHSEYGLENVHLKEIASIHYQTEDAIPLLAVVFTTSSLNLQEKKNRYYTLDKELMFISYSELKELTLDSPELFTAELIWAVQAGWLK